MKRYILLFIAFILVLSFSARLYCQDSPDYGKTKIAILQSKVFFDLNKKDITESASAILEEVAAILIVYPKNKIHLEGHADSSGLPEKNVRLSMERAESVRDFLIQKGIDADRMKVFGFGDKKPIYSNDSESGRERNRRVEIIILRADNDSSENAESKEAIK